MAHERIVFLSGPRQGNAFEIDDTVVIGRNPSSSIYLEDPQVSRRHATIERTPNGTFLRDLGSGNGTYVGNRRIIECRLSDGDIIRIGGTEFRYEGAAAASGVHVAPPPAKPAEALGGHVEAADAANVYETFFQAPRTAVTLEQLRDAQNRLAAVYKANQIIASEQDLRKLFAAVMDQIFSLVPAHNGVILLKDEKSGELITEYVKSGSGNTVISSTIVSRAFEHGEAILTVDAADDARFEAGASIIAQNISSAMCTPLTHQGERLGALYVDTRGTTNAFTKSDLELLVALSGPAAVAIRNAQYLHKLERAYHDTLIATANAVEMRDHYTVGHTWRVTNFALEIMRGLGWTEEQLKQGEMGGVLHDVGKIAVDDAILRKPGKLTDEEYAKMKIHPERGATYLRDIEFLKPLVPYCLYHHERYDGKGYPFGLAGKDIPLEGRLIAVADTFDAMTSNRPYRKGLDPQIAIDELLKGRGTQFDPECVDALVEAYHAGRISRIIQESLAGGMSIACPFCSTFIGIPEGTPVGQEFECNVCHRRVKLLMMNDAYYGELLAQTS
ncbi:MAG TPA: FHA domain-containing protein [Candidatus Hydrogenedentes bacterium]|nr:FHA domain-containing protein [Candidatus Hydrogenedentota bacterium]HOV74197.1 FHA domain-containing protein [Candidatus Hydrogenedentota bacterium]